MARTRASQKKKNTIVALLFLFSFFLLFSS